MVKRSTKKQQASKPYYTQYNAALIIMALLVATLVVRLMYIQIFTPEKFLQESERRTTRIAQKYVQRGTITDRHGVELAVSVQSKSIIVIPERIREKGSLQKDEIKWRALLEQLDIGWEHFVSLIEDTPRGQRILKKHVSFVMMEYISALNLPGISFESDSERHYPLGEVAAHVVGITSSDEGRVFGIEGAEFAFDAYLQGEPGKKRYVKDGRGNELEVLDVQASREPGPLMLSIDHRIQNIAYTELKRAVKYYQATSGSAVIVDVKTGEVLAMANSPSYNPNNRGTLQHFQVRNRAITDNFEPGSTVKPLVVLSALETGVYDTRSQIDTSPGWFRVGGKRVQDSTNEGVLGLGGILARSSNVGTAKVALELGINPLLESYYAAGFGDETGLALPGESYGAFSSRTQWSPFEIAALSYGYGFSVTAAQLAHMYATIGNGGIDRPLTIVKQEQVPEGRQVYAADAIQELLPMMVQVTSKGGTGIQAGVRGYQVAGKTGTSRKAIYGGYGEEYVALFAGVLPASDPQIAIVVMINEPSGDNYYGGSTAAPTFSKIASQSARILNLVPDNLDQDRVRVASMPHLRVRDAHAAQ